MEIRKGEIGSVMEFVLKIIEEIYSWWGGVKDDVERILVRVDGGSRRQHLGCIQAFLEFWSWINVNLTVAFLL